MTVQNEQLAPNDDATGQSQSNEERPSTTYFLCFPALAASSVAALAVQLPPGNGFLWIVPTLIAAGWPGRYSVWAALNVGFLLLTALLAGHVLTTAGADTWALLATIAIGALAFGRLRQVQDIRQVDAISANNSEELRHLLSSFSNNGLALIGLRRRIAKRAGHTDCVTALDDVRSRMTVLARACLRRADTPTSGNVSMDEAITIAVAAGLHCPATELPDQVHIAGLPIFLQERQVSPLMLLFYEMSDSIRHIIQDRGTPTSLQVMWRHHSDALGVEGIQIKFQYRTSPQNSEFDGIANSAYAQEIIRSSRQQLRADIRESSMEDGVLTEIFFPQRLS